MTFQIITDSTADLSADYIERSGLLVLGMTIAISGKDYETIGENRLTSDELLDLLSAGKTATTSAIGSGLFQEIFTDFAKREQEVLYLAFSSGLSGTYQSALIARDMVLEEYPTAKITVLDTLAAASGEGYLVEEAVALRDEGKTLSETVEQLSFLIPRLRSWFSVDDLNHLARGGRISKASAALGTLANIKPILDVDPSGHLRPIGKIRGTKKAHGELLTQSLADLDEEHRKIIIAYSGDKKTAEELALEFEKANAALELSIRPLGPVIAAHTGSGTLAIFTIGKNIRI